MEKFNVTMSEQITIKRLLTSIKQKICQKGGSSIDPVLVDFALQDIIAGEFSHQIAKNEVDTGEILRLVPQIKPGFIQACDGSQTIADAKDIFLSGIDSEFIDWGTNVPGPATAVTPFEIYDLVKDATFQDMGINSGKLFFTQHQIKLFCIDHFDLLTDDLAGTFFPSKIKISKIKSAEEEQYFVIRVLKNSDGLYARLYKGRLPKEWFAQSPPRIIVPRLLG
ncbi:hypothetical protein GW920_00975 [Candidatus Falkowbacteria bacterium]|uniref:Uncharacterized protein n=1 Tax=Candidatus Falkowbacteria bacterium CG10_big_fil_rev_8_21_14_0_10_37_18 TaxID=1974562 RepID=A0A2H0V938_9BACT|nr:hypothetical protein [Candidatus Falkowbacteria bacterium]NCQ12744.1 hypothetical protein [Candidatus Falkowbacteria bacterium]OIO05381.1 MAG: hypothetical protein AUJ26_03360 [Candidatus Falkowbacteria bacterium CG1_02_37_21]PIR95612.1 MAG: hypothetical protein COT93_01630 [Candidatus Falkowbacteria bacterium CG10_big_fil_rev_8_21_14_0_10_37_18]